MSQANDRTTGSHLTSGFFITGTDTDVGKTYATGCIAHTLIEQGKQIIPRKPIASGCIPQPDGSLLCHDAEFLKTASQSKESLETICPYQFEPAVSPQTALEMAGQYLSTEVLAASCQLPAAPQKNDIYLIEGAGGFYSPLCSDGLNKDLAQQLQLPVILVVKSQLGCLNHALLTLDAIDNAGLETHSIILNYADQNNYADDLRKWTELPIYQLDFKADLSLQMIDSFRL